MKGAPYLGEWRPDLPTWISSAVLRKCVGRRLGSIPTLLTAEGGRTDMHQGNRCELPWRSRCTKEMYSVDWGNVQTQGIP